jgi:hypothetical protein
LAHLLIFINSRTLWFGIFIHRRVKSWHQLATLLHSQVSLPLNKKIQQSSILSTLTSKKRFSFPNARDIPTVCPIVELSISSYVLRLEDTSFTRCRHTVHFKSKLVAGQENVTLANQNMASEDERFRLVNLLCKWSETEQPTVPASQQAPPAPRPLSSW